MAQLDSNDQHLNRRFFQTRVTGARTASP